ncbi:MAG: sugar ABC transporter permease, partial [Bosea sp. (in: a-proteobacteria)]
MSNTASPATATAGRVPRLGGRDRESSWTPYLFIAPVALYLAVFQ